jgi:hypothetical protein
MVYVDGTSDPPSILERRAVAQHESDTGKPVRLHFGAVLFVQYAGLICGQQNEFKVRADERGNGCVGCPGIDLLDCRARQITQRRHMLNKNPFLLAMGSKRVRGKNRNILR